MLRRNGRSVTVDGYTIRDLDTVDYTLVSRCCIGWRDFLNDLCGPYLFGRFEDVAEELQESARCVALVDREHQVVGVIAAFDPEPAHQRSSFEWIPLTSAQPPAAILRAALSYIVEHHGISHFTAFCTDASRPEKRACLAELGFTHCGTLPRHTFLNGAYRDLELWQRVEGR